MMGHSEPLTYLDILVRISSEHPHNQRVVDYCFELSSLHADFFWMLEWLETSYGLTLDMDPPESGLGLIRKKFLITRTEDDFSFRLYAYQEKVYQLINLVCNIGLNERDPKQRENILNWLENNEPPLREELRFFKDNIIIRDMIDRRQSLTHRLSKYDLQILGRTERFLEWLSWDPALDTLAEKDATDVAVSSFNIDNLYQKSRQKLEEVERDISAFGHALCAEILSILSHRDLLKN